MNNNSHSGEASFPVLVTRPNPATALCQETKHGESRHPLQKIQPRAKPRFGQRARFETAVFFNLSPSDSPRRSPSRLFTTSGLASSLSFLLPCTAGLAQRSKRPAVNRGRRGEPFGEGRGVR